MITCFDKMYNKRALFIILTAAFLLTLVMYIPLRDAEFWVIDDHEIIVFHQEITESKSGFLKSITDAWLSTEVGSFPNTSRFRPVYYFIRIIKSVLFENNATYWFAFQTILFFISLTVFCMAIQRFLPISITVASMAVLASLPFNMDMWLRLGPGENEAFFFFMLFFFALTRLGKNAWAWPLSCITAAAAMGYKENFIFLLIPLCAGFIYQKFINKQKTSLLWAILPCSLSVLLAILMIKILMGNMGHVYAVKTSTSGLLKISINYFKSYHFILSFIMILPLIPVRGFVKKDFFDAHIIKHLTYLYTIFAIVIVMSYCNYIFYHGNIGIGSRYAFPYLFFLMIPPLLTANFYMAYFKDNKVVNKIIAVGIILLVIPIAFAQVKLFRNSLKHVMVTKEFKHILDMGKNFKSIVLVNTGQPISMYEPFYSLKRFSKAHLTASAVVYFPLFHPQPDSDLNRELEKHLKQSVAEQKEVSLVQNETMLLSINHAGYQIIDFTANERQPIDIPQEVEKVEQGATSVLRKHFFVFTPEYNISDFQLIGDIAQDTVFFVNGLRFDATEITLNHQAVTLNIKQKQNIEFLKNLYIITLEYSLRGGVKIHML